MKPKFKTFKGFAQHQNRQRLLDRNLTPAQVKSIGELLKHSATAKFTEREILTYFNFTIKSSK